ncbi:hypothetical protein GCM10022241_21650 [Micrococcus endophyticus]
MRARAEAAGAVVVVVDDDGMPGPDAPAPGCVEWAECESAVVLMAFTLPADLGGAGRRRGWTLGRAGSS